ncbi:MAG: hypothetical protein AAF573_04920 [Bacteroidota bacterium]
MKKIFILIGCLTFCLASSLAQKPQEILGIAKEQQSKEYYERQHQLWRGVVQKDQKNANAWWQMYKAQRAFLQLSEPKIWANDQNAIFKKLEPIVGKAKRNVGNSYEYFLMEYANTKDRDRIQFIEKAYQIDPTRKEAFEGLLIHYTLTFQDRKAEEMAKKMLESNYYSNACLMWNYNQLQTIEPNGIFITNGDLDAIPKWVLQGSQELRKDVLVISKWMMSADEKYRKTVFQKINVPASDQSVKDFPNTVAYINHLVKYIMENATQNVYVACGTPVHFFENTGIADKVYLVGNAFVYSKKDFDNEKVLVKNLEAKYELGYLLVNFQKHPEDAMIKSQMNPTYIPALMKAKQYFEQKGNRSRASYYASLIQQITKDSGREEEIKSWYKD